MTSTFYRKHASITKLHISWTLLAAKSGAINLRAVCSITLPQFIFFTQKTSTIKDLDQLFYLLVSNQAEVWRYCCKDFTSYLLPISHDV